MGLAQLPVMQAGGEQRAVDAGRELLDASLAELVQYAVAHRLLMPMRL